MVIQIIGMILVKSKSCPRMWRFPCEANGPLDHWKFPPSKQLKPHKALVQGGKGDNLPNKLRMWPVSMLAISTPCTGTKLVKESCVKLVCVSLCMLIDWTIVNRISELYKRERSLLPLGTAASSKSSSKRTYLTIKIGVSAITCTRF